MRKTASLCILHKWKAFKLDGLRQKKLIFCNRAWPQYKLGDQKVWLENGTLSYHTVLLSGPSSKLLATPRVSAEVMEKRRFDAEMPSWKNVREADMRMKQRAPTLLCRALFSF